MKEFLIGVIVGGIIGSIFPVVTLIIAYKKWKRNL